MATNAIDDETAVAPRESLAFEVDMEGVKELCRFLLLDGMEIVEWLVTGKCSNIMSRKMGQGKVLIQGTQRLCTTSEKY
jgi:hypothetical protein